ncbi:MAG: DUF2273 domain-containing protein [Syntrophomonadaceae bacterium]|nr:DUF2273 domain-containing protein [Syntrophomonadaceae bacterium]
MWEKLLLSLINKHRGKTIGILIGLLASILFISYGFWKAIFIIICISLGYFIGRKIDEDKNLELWIKQLFKDKEQ